MARSPRALGSGHHGLARVGVEAQAEAAADVAACPVASADARVARPERVFYRVHVYAPFRAMTGPISMRH